MKKITKITLLLLALMLTLCAAVACGDTEEPGTGGSVTEISVTETGMPQLLYVVGTELDLSNGLLQVKEGDTTKEIPLNTEGVTVTGYDKTRVGEQTLTITYGGKTTQIVVTVVQRMQAVEYVADYLVGNPLDLSRGRLKIFRNDGTDYKVTLADSKVAVTGFDAGKTGTQTLTATYQSGEESYTCSFDVTVYAMESATLTAPKKTSYNSHDGVLDATGGLLTFTGKNGALKKEVTVTKDMISGFDLSAVNKDNTPLMQTLTVTYGEKTYQYDVKLVYTGVSRFKDECAPFLSLNWESEEYPAYETLGELSLELMEIYMDLSFAEQSYITKEEYLNVARTALMYGMDRMEDEFEQLQDAFIVSGGEYYFTCTSYDKVKAAVELMQNEENDIYRYSPLILQMIEAFKEETVTPDFFFGDLGMIDHDTYGTLLLLLEHVLDVADKMLLIGTDWQEVGVQTYAPQIEALYRKLVVTDYEGSVLSELYTLVSKWRADDDLFDILYTYYYNQNDLATLRTLAPLGLPGELRLVLAHAYGMIDQLSMISQYAQNDATMLFYHYYAALTAADRIKNGPDGMVKELYNTLPVNAILGMDDDTSFYIDDLLNYLCTMEGGYYQFCGSMLGIEKYHVLLDLYVDLVMQSLDNPAFEGSAEYKSNVETMMALYIALTPAEQLNFLGTLNVFYIANMPPLMFETDEDAQALSCLFVMILNQHYGELLGEENVKVYQDLMLAIEIYAKRFSIEDWKTKFLAKMDAVTAALPGLDDVTEEKFYAYLGAAYEKYLAISARYAEDAKEPDLGVWKEKFEQLAEALVNVELSSYLIVQGNMQMYTMLFSAYERALVLANEILAAPEEIVKIYYYEPLYQFMDVEAEEGEEPSTPTVSLDHAMWHLRAVYINSLLTLNNGSSIYDFYVTSDLPAFLAAAYDVIWPYMYQDEDPATASFDKARVFAAMKLFRELSAEEQMVFAIWMDSQYGIYYAALDAFFAELNMTDAANKAAVALQKLENACLIYRVMLSEEAFDAMELAFAELQTAYAGVISAEDKASFADFEEAYAYYLKLCQELIAAGVPDAV